MKYIVLMKFGSHLYGTDTPDSDIDYKGVYFPEPRDIFLSKINHTINNSTGSNDRKNTAEDVDSEIFSIHQFIKLACEGQTVAIDMLHAPDSMIVEKTDIWDSIISNRDKFYTRNLKAFVGYCRRQASKYGIKGSRLSDANKVRDVLMDYDEDIRMSDIWHLLPEGEHIHHMTTQPTENREIRIYQVCGKKYLETVRIKDVLKSLDVFIEQYGHRAELAKDNQGIDWKALSHAMRAAYQLEEIYTKGNITFPLKEAEYLKAVKTGKLDYLTEVAPRLEELMERTEILSESSNLPEKVDTAFWDDFLFNVICESIGE